MDRRVAQNRPKPPVILNTSKACNKPKIPRIKSFELKPTHPYSCCTVHYMAIWTHIEWFVVIPPSTNPSNVASLIEHGGLYRELPQLSYNPGMIHVSRVCSWIFQLFVPLPHDCGLTFLPTTATRTYSDYVEPRHSTRIDLGSHQSAS